MAPNELNLERLKQLMRASGAKQLYLKRLAENDNSKNQIYLGPDLTALNVLPNGPLASDPGKPNLLKSPLHFSWITPAGTVIRAPGAQLILYPHVLFTGWILRSPSFFTRSAVPRVQFARRSINPHRDVLCVDIDRQLLRLALVQCNNNRCQFVKYGKYVLINAVVAASTSLVSLSLVVNLTADDPSERGSALSILIAACVIHTVATALWSLSDDYKPANANVTNSADRNQQGRGRRRVLRRDEYQRHVNWHRRM